MLILISGITGMCGQACARAALESDHQVRGLGRTPDKLKKDISDHLESFIKIDGIYDLGGLDRAVADVDAIISAVTPIPEVILEGQLLLLRAAERAGVKIFHAATWNFDWTKIPLGEIEIYDALISFWNHARISSSIKPLHAFTGIILEYQFYQAPRGNPIDKANKTFTYFGTGDEVSAYSSVDDLAEYTIEAISEPDAAAGGFYYVESFHCSSHEMARTYEQVRGVKLEMKCAGSAQDVEKLLANARATIPPTRFMEYNSLAFGAALLKGRLDYDAVDSRRWCHIVQTSWKEWLEYNPEI